MKPILCALDFSESSADAMKVALELAARFETCVNVLFTYRLVQTNGALAEYRKNMEAWALQNFEALVSKMNIKDSIKFDFRSEIGFLTDRLDVYSKQNKVSFIVMSRDMVTALNEQKGISTQEFLTSLKTPVVIVPHESN